MTVTVPAHGRLQFTPDINISRLINGMWQVSGAHGRIDPAAAVAEMFTYHDHGLTTWDLADHYGPAEDLIGTFRQRLAAERGDDALDCLQVFTKWVPRPQPMTAATVQHAVDRSRQRMHMETLDLLQFHWWDYNNLAYLDALAHLSELREQGVLRYVALTNFDTERLRVITEHGIEITANQVQYSLIDMRPAAAMTPYCQQHNIWLLPYGVLCGGLLAERYVGAPEPRRADLTTASLQKYKQMIDLWGGWALFQELLTVVHRIARTHGVSIANVATRSILDQPMVAGAMVGARLGVSAHISDNMRVFDLTLSDDERAAIADVQSRGNDLLRVIGDCGDEYR